MESVECCHSLTFFFSTLPCQGEKRSSKGQTCNLCYPYQGHETKPVNNKKTRNRQLLEQSTALTQFLDYLSLKSNS